MGWDSVVSSIASGVKEAGAFAKGAGTGVVDGTSSMISGLSTLAKGALGAVQASGRAIVDPAYRQEKMDQATALARSAADYGGRLYDDPSTRQHAYDQVQAAVGSIKDQFVAARDKAEKQGKLSEFYGSLAGRGGFEAAALLVPVSKLGALGKASAVAEEAAHLGKVAKVGEAMGAGRAGAVTIDCAEASVVAIAKSEAAYAKALEGLQVAQGADVEAYAAKIASEATHVSGDVDRVVLGRWVEDGGYSAEAKVNGGTWFETKRDFFSQLSEGISSEEARAKAWAVNEQFLKSQLEKGVGRIDLYGESISEVLLSRPNSFTAMEVKFVEDNAERFGYVREANSWIKAK